MNKDSRFQEIQKYFLDNKIPLREEDVIIEYFKKHAAKDNKSVNPGIWQMIRNGWEKGIEDEKKGGGDEVSRSMGLDTKLNHVTNKWKTKEYANGLGALEKIWGQ